MKKIFFVLFAIIISSHSFSQVLNVVKNDGEVKAFYLSDVVGISFTGQASSNAGLNKLIVHTPASAVQMLLTEIDSIFFDDGGTIAFFQTANGLNQVNISEIDSITLGSSLDTTIYITYNDTAVAVINPFESLGVTVEVSGADVVVKAAAEISNIDYVLTGTTSNGMFKIYSDKKLNLHLNNVNITNTDGPAINIQSSKKITVDLVEGTNNALTDGKTYAEAPNDEDQGAAFFSEGQLIFTGAGKLEINGVGEDQHGLECDDYIEIDAGSIIINSAAKDGINVNDGFFMNGGAVDITSNSDGIDGGENVIEITGGTISITNKSNDKSAVKSDSTIGIYGGNVNITVEGDQSKGLDSKQTIMLNGGVVKINTTGNAVLESSGSGYDPSYCTAIKADLEVSIDSCSININTSGTAGRGISCDGDVNMTSGTLKITSSGGGKTYTNTSGEADAYTGPCIKTDGSLTIAGGEVTLSHSGSGGKGISVDSKINFGTTKSEPVINITTTGQSIAITSGRPGTTGDYVEAKAISADSAITIEKGIVTISSADDGIKSKEFVTINSGIININKSVEGIEAPNIFVNGGEVNINSSDDGFNATYGSGGEMNDGSNLTINEGQIYISVTQGDAIDSNGDVFINGGVIVAHGPQSAPEVGLDYNGTCKVNGGLLVISGTNSNMLQGPGPSSTQHSVVLKSNQSISAGTLFHIEDANGTNLLTFAPKRTYYSIIYSAPELNTGVTYKVYTGGSSTGTELNGLYTGGIYSGGTLRKTFNLTGITQTISF